MVQMLDHISAPYLLFEDEPGNEPKGALLANRVATAAGTDVLPRTDAVFKVRVDRVQISDQLVEE